MIDAMTFGDLLTQMNIIDEMSTGKAVKERYLAASGQRSIGPIPHYHTKGHIEEEAKDTREILTYTMDATVTALM